MLAKLNIDLASHNTIAGEQFAHRPGCSVIEPSYLAESEADLRGAELIAGQRLLVKRTATWTRPLQQRAPSMTSDNSQHVSSDNTEKPAAHQKVCERDSYRHQKKKTQRL